MNEVFRNDRNRKAASDGKHHRDLSTMAFYGVMGLVAAFLMIMPFAKPIQQVVFSKFHLTTESYAAWVVLQGIPNMYAFKNQIRMLHPVQQTRYVNHYPAQYMTERQVRPAFLRLTEPAHLEMVTTLNGTHFDTTWVAVAGSKPDRIVIRQHE